jgi:DNA-binding NtrC family response regulator
VDIPPLRDRGNDIVLLAQHYIDKVNVKRAGRKLKGLSSEVATIFKNYRWMGNVRELRNVIERASILEDGEYVTATHLPADMLGGNHSRAGGIPGVVLPPEGIPLESVEVDLARQAIARTGGNLTRAAKLLDISRDQLRYKLKKAGDLESDDAEDAS